MVMHWIWEQPDWPQFRWDAEELLPALRSAHAQRLALQQLLNQLDSSLLQEAEAALLSRESLSTAGIEGEQLDPAEVRSSVARRLQLPLESQQPRPSAKVDGLVQTLFTATSDLEAPLSLNRLNTWHRTLFAAGPDGLRAIQIGELRSDDPMQVVSGPIGRETLHFQAPPREGLEAALQQLIDWFNAPPEGLDGLVRAGLSHLWLVTLHPYDDGNGRLARALSDRALAQLAPEGLHLQHALSLSAQIQQQRQKYYLQLERCQKGTLNVTAWLLWFLAQLRTGAEHNGAVVEAVRAKALFWWSHRHHSFNPRQQKLLNRLLDAEPEGFEGGLTLRKVIGLSRTSRATAWRDLRELVELEALEPIGAGRSSAYRIRWPHTHQSAQPHLRK
jgi:Fic family protein